MSLRIIRSILACSLAAACFSLAATSCGRSPSAPGGRLTVSVLQDADQPSPGKSIEVLGTTLAATTDANGYAEFTLAAGSYVVRAYDIGTPGPARPYVDQDVRVEAAGTSKALFYDCRLCR